MADLGSRVRQGLIEYADATPVAAPPPFAAPGTPRRWRYGPALAAAAVAAVLATVAISVPIARRGGPDPGTSLINGPTLPSEFAAYSIATGTVGDSPPGRVIACFLYNTEQAWDPPQVVVLAADADRYRVVTAADADRPPLWQRRPVLLSGDGARLAVGSDDRAVSQIVVVDLLTGEETGHAIDPGSKIDLLTWSPDARLLAYAVRPFRESETFPGVHARGGRLMVLDIRTGESRVVGGAELPPSVAEAAFSPDGSLLAVQGGGPSGGEHRQGYDRTILIVRFVDAEVVATVSVPSSYRLAGPAAWAPDSSRLALVTADDAMQDPVGGWLRTLDRSDDGSWEVGPPAPTVPRGVFLGWQFRDRLLLHAQVGDPVTTPRSIVAVNFPGGAYDPLSRPEVEVRSDMMVASLQLAYSLLPDLRVRSAGEPDRGPWPVWLRVSVTVVVLLALGIASAVVFAVRGWTRSRRMVTSSPDS
jgi:hypothetical protein